MTDVAQPDLVRNSWMLNLIDEAKAGRLPTPTFASWLITRACNLKCYYCFASARKKDPDELTTGEAMRVIEDLADTGVFYLSYIGGEPLLRKDIYQLIDYSTDLGIYTGIHTNGMLVREDTVAKLKDVGCQILGVSIDSHDPIVHDRVRGVSGSLVGAKRAVLESVKAGIRCSIRIVVTEDSLPALPDLFNWARDTGVEELIIIPIFMVGRAAGTPDDRRADILGKELFWKGLDVLREVANPLGITVPEEKVACCVGIELNTPDKENHHAGHAFGFERSTGCRVGKFIMNIQPNGDIFSCPFVQHKIGSLRTQSVREIWAHPLLRAAREGDMGCHARSIIHTGRPDVVDPTYNRSTEDLLAELPAGAKPLSLTPIQN
ncbi:radical SAM protein [Amycolatopsis samaneae]|uniref:Radical SAM/SPASM domain-containing protein n=1 Tax=Amycolatopsis samaneae TaxID=664691 RepID=A0ABW5GPB3_9PSEU